MSCLSDSDDGAFGNHSCHECAYVYVRKDRSCQSVDRFLVTYQDDRGTTYNDYTKAMKLITTAYKELREELSSEVFGKPLADLSDAEMQVIYMAISMNVSEIEPKDIRR